MTSVKILHCADLHIGAAESFLGTLAGRRRFETLLTFEKIIDLAVAENVSVVAVAGDLFDSNAVEDELVRPVLEKIAAVPQIRVVYAAGNHDPLTPDSPVKRFPLPENLFVLDAEDTCLTFEDISLKVYGRSFDSAAMKGEGSFPLAPDNDGYVHLMVLHGDFGGETDSPYNAVSREFVRTSGMDYLALGHVHTCTPIEKAGSTSFAYCGCPEGQGFDETGEKGVYLGSIAQGVCDLRFVPVSRRLHLRRSVDISGLSSSAAVSDRVLAALREEREDFAEHLYKIRLIGEIPPTFTPDLDEITARLSGAVYYLSMQDETSLAVDADRLCEEVSLKGLFVKNLMEAMRTAPPDQKPLYSAALKLGLAAFGSEVAYHED